MKSDAYPVKFEVRKYLNKEGAYLTVGKSEERKVQDSKLRQGSRIWVLGAGLTTHDSAILEILNFRHS